MKKLQWIGVVAVAVSVAAWAQQPAQGGRVIQVPFGNGVYYQGSAGWINLPFSVLVPFPEMGWRYWLDLPRNYHADVPGLHSGVALATNRPTFYLRGYQPGTDLRLVRQYEMTDYRRVKLDGSRDSNVWAKFRPQDLTPVEVESIATGVVTVRPRTDLKPGEYALVAPAQKNLRGLNLAYEFSIVQSTATR
jgi:hypothetical protein